MSSKLHILHCDMNCFYASVELQRQPELRDRPLAVCGSQEERHGIVLTANYIAKPFGVKTGMAIWRAREHCPDLVIVPPDMDECIDIRGISVACEWSQRLLMKFKTIALSVA